MMKPKITWNKKSGEMIVSYFKVHDKYHFRLELLKHIIAVADTNITVIFNTNQCTMRQAFEEIDCSLGAAGIPYDSWPVEADPKRLLGFNTDILRKGKTKKQQLYVAALSPDQFTEDVFEKLFQYYDLLLGFGRQMDHTQIMDALKAESYDSIMFNEKYFENSLYDSVVCDSIRSTMDIAPQIKAMRV